MIVKHRVLSGFMVIAVLFGLNDCVKTPMPDAPCNVAAERQIVVEPAVVFTFVAEASENLCVHVLVDATDQNGGKGLNPEGGTYPWEGIRPTPYKHIITVHPGLKVSASFRVYTLAKKPGGWIRCRVVLNGHEVPESRTQKNVLSTNTSVVCLYTLGTSK